ncbi:GNAT family N-acetyltransferase [Micromonospora coxensis]|uniref:Protein N-acetyltransferase, RimJ/RimL family n=1 Tax=Micromonospora coxensis TaxID=356852 RepID=A0A1C5J9L7_9ACTN|nr:GNAT family N-acetyltransferase [Micromonospora coxensis]SCG67260.1 Protein N-acetyltransferase, RimJ/RimL family [Micromonospora coxensis]
MIPEVVAAGPVRLRPFRPADADDLAAGCGDPENLRFNPGMPRPYTVADARWWIAEGAPAARAAGGVAYAVVDAGTDRLVGGAGLSQVVPGRDQAEVGYWVAPWARRRGIATAVTRALAATAFHAGLVRLELLTHAENPASQRVALAAGFRPEGVRRAAGRARDGGRHDLLAWVRLTDDPDGPTPRVLPDLPGGRLTDGVVTLRRLAPDDVDPLYRLHTLPEVVASRVRQTPPTRAAIERRCAVAESEWLVGDSADFALCDASTGEVAGGCALVHDEPATGQGMVGYSLLPEARGRGLATRAVRLMAGWAFGIGFARLWAGTAPENVASQRVLERAGFRPEGLMRGRLPGRGESRTDTLLFALLATDHR